MYEEITKHTQVVVSELLEQAKLKPGSLFVVGCSSSEMVGKRIGKGSSMDAAKAAFLGVYPLLQKAGIHLAVQCCEHLNRALIMERTAAEAKGYEIVNVMPQPHAGGSMAVTAWNAFEDPVAVEKIQADAGMDIGGTLIGMHLRQDNPVIPPRFAAILRKHPFPTVKNAYSHKKTKLCLWYGYRSDGHFIIEMIRRVLLTRAFVHGEENNGDFLRIFCVPTVLTAVLPGGKVWTNSISNSQRRR